MNYILRLAVIVIAFFSYSNSYGQNIAMKNTVDSIVQNYMSQQNTSGMAIAIYYGGNEYFYNYGVANQSTQTPVTSNTVFELASVTKIFTTSALSVLVQQGKLKLTDPVVNYLPALANTSGLPIDQVRIVDLATHTASFPRDINQFGATKTDQAGFMQGLQNWQPNNPVGSQYLYSNVGFGLLGKALSNVTGQNYQSLLNNLILQPLGMKNTTVAVPSDPAQQAQGYNAQGPAPLYQPGFLYGGGALRSTARDMLTFLEANLGVRPNVPATLQTALLNAQKGYFQVKPNFTMALGWQRMTGTGTLLMTKNGMNQGFSTFIGFAPNQKFGVVVLANKRDAMATKVGNQLLQALLGNS